VNLRTPQRCDNSPGHSLPIDRNVPALLIRLDRNPFHHGTLAAIRSLGRLGVEVHAVLDDRPGPVARSRFLAGHRTWDPSSFVETLLEAAERIGRRAVVLPLDDISAIRLAEHSRELAKAFYLPEQADELPRRLADKRALATICAELGLAHPDTVVVESMRDLRRAAMRFGYPLIAKWAKPWLVSGGATSVVHSDDQARVLLGRAGENELLFQRLIPYAPRADWFFHGYFDPDSGCVFEGTGCKDRAYPPAAGLTTLGRWLPNLRVAELAKELAAALRYSGILDMDFRYNARDDRYYLLDFNPRIGAQFRLFRDGNGLDVVRAAHLSLTGRRPPACRPAYGRVYLVENYDLLRKVVGRRSMRTSARPGWLRSVRRADELAWYSRDDVRPFLQMLKYTALRGLNRR
jgi:predicted ATP-grasp superfamily ATP-dependent carboligase